jgi:hypothetical protein
VSIDPGGGAYEALTRHMAEKGPVRDRTIGTEGSNPSRSSTESAPIPAVSSIMRAAKRINGDLSDMCRCRHCSANRPGLYAFL